MSSATGPRRRSNDVVTTVAGNVGGIWRDGQTLYSTQAGSQLTYAFALGYDITPLVGIFAEITGATSLRKLLLQ